MFGIELDARDVLVLQRLLSGEPLEEAKKDYALGAREGYNPDFLDRCVRNLLEKIERLAGQKQGV